jgi:hypothetical protein
MSLLVHFTEGFIFQEQGGTPGSHERRSSSDIAVAAKREVGLRSSGSNDHFPHDTVPTHTQIQSPGPSMVPDQANVTTDYTIITRSNWKAHSKLQHWMEEAPQEQPWNVMMLGVTKSNGDKEQEDTVDCNEEERQQ